MTRPWAVSARVAFAMIVGCGPRGTPEYLPGENAPAYSYGSTAPVPLVGGLTGQVFHLGCPILERLRQTEATSALEDRSPELVLADARSSIELDGLRRGDPPEEIQRRLAQLESEATRAMEGPGLRVLRIDAVVVHAVETYLGRENPDFVRVREERTISPVFLIIGLCLARMRG